MFFRTVLSDKHFLAECRRRAAILGIFTEQHNASEFFIRQLPVTLLPLPLRRKHHNTLSVLQPILNRMLVRIAADSEFVNDKLRDSDEFTLNLLEIYNDLRRNSPMSRTNLGIFRSDYIIDGDDAKQVEMNTISVSFPGLMLKVQQFHRHMMRLTESEIPAESLPLLRDDESSVSAALARAHTHYCGEMSSDADKRIAILFVIENGATNVYDMHAIMDGLQQDNITIHHCVFSELSNKIIIGARGELIYHPRGLGTDAWEISVVYFRTGYVPVDYDFDGAWSLRATLEQSLAIKCPSVDFQLAGMKYIQSSLSDPDVLRRFLTSTEIENSFENILDTFAKFYPLDSNTIELIGKSPSKYVLKNNLEGGGHNVFGDEIIPALKDVQDKGLESQYNLMQFLAQQPETTVIIDSKCASLQSVQVNTELGIYGTVLATTSPSNLTPEFHFSHGWGHLLRVKHVSSNEAGVMHGDGALSSVYLVD